MKDMNYYVNSQLKYKRAVPTVISLLITRVGKKKAITLMDITKKLQKKIAGFNDRTLRMAIHEIRVKHLIPGLVADNTGFYVETNPQNLLKYIARIDGYIRQHTAAKKAIIKDMLYLNQQKKKRNSRMAAKSALKQSVNKSVKNNRLLSRALNNS